MKHKLKHEPGDQYGEDHNRPQCQRVRDLSIPRLHDGCDAVALLPSVECCEALSFRSPPPPINSNGFSTLNVSVCGNLITFFCQFMVGIAVFKAELAPARRSESLWSLGKEEGTGKINKGDTEKNRGPQRVPSKRSSIFYFIVFRSLAAPPPSLRHFPPAYSPGYCARR